jgi:2-keto-4-pentenoate hydratase/2-oxohepta-3-ene-1,7-dioic acid hydratase in catechol pathway
VRLATFDFKGHQEFGIITGDTIASLNALAKAFGRDESPFASVAEFLAHGHPAMEAARELTQRALRDWNDWVPLSNVHLQCPVPRPSKIVAIGLNYRDHAEEAHLAIPTQPLFFAKFPSSINGPFDPVIIPNTDPEVDYEAELAVVIGKRGKHITADDAYDFVAGYMTLNDVSARKWQFSDKQWTRGKSCDTFCPAGPWLTTRDEIADPHHLRVVARVNGRIVQDSDTSNMIFGVPQLIEHISEAITLEPGDIIATGTPAGVGVFKNPPSFLRAGDIVEVKIDGLGAIRNTMQRES